MMISIGFMTQGLFSICRHPNYSAEISFWFVFYLFSLTAGASILNWSLVGSVLLCLLFQGSTALSESITSNKYPKYHRYKTEVPRFLWIWNPFQSKYLSPFLE
ncbi:uncharacterized protein C594.04c [Eurytemora carolleeae]|uniref:uncharacterized protein C594.04c n=1 Tax=Eurytemora carolleeae TaxID=1294199 RepID=UPI000C773AE9|nr:uncharacterized protein C594.04c [Eurytemora carolleeae]|eukprot:XP_023348767.1 uncharacterized protein C594.04c-like [Eurytemora affinis]